MKLGYMVGGEEVGTKGILAIGSYAYGSNVSGTMAQISPWFLWGGVIIDAVGNMAEAGAEMQDGISPAVAIPGAAVNFVTTTIPPITVAVLTDVAVGGVIAGPIGAFAGALVGLATTYVIIDNLPNNVELGEDYDAISEESLQNPTMWQNRYIDGDHTETVRSRHTPLAFSDLQ